MDTSEAVLQLFLPVSLKPGSATADQTGMVIALPESQYTVLKKSYKLIHTSMFTIKKAHLPQQACHNITAWLKRDQMTHQ